MENILPYFSHSYAANITSFTYYFFFIKEKQICTQAEGIMELIILNLIL